MKRLLNAFKWGWAVYTRPTVFQRSMLQILDAQNEFLKEVAETGKPRITHLASIYVDSDGKSHEQRILSLWCSANDHPIMTRLEELAQENQALKNIVHGRPMPQSELEDIASFILAKYEDDHEYHFHKVDRQWIIKAMLQFRAFR
jgi:hypothetical protein